MARTKQTARKSTGGTAPRRKLATKAARGRLAIAARRAANLDDDGDAEVVDTGVAEGDDSDRDRALYDEQLLHVSDALKEVERPGDCFTGGSFSQFPLPGLMIEGLGEVPLPLMKKDAKDLMSKCHLAPYGHGEETIVKTAVRNTWEINASQIQFQNPKWAAFIDSIVKAIATPLGINDSIEFEAQPYKMLLYEEGGMFLKHQDNEKVTGMFGTLVMMLPCRFEGGDLHVHHLSQPNAEPHVWSPGSMCPYDLKYAAFYGDCEHEVKPVTSGYRLSLTYNLVTLATTRVPRFAGNHELYERLELSLEDYFKHAEGESDSDDEHRDQKRPRLSTKDHRNASSRTRPRDAQLVYMLEHKYTNPGLSFTYLKNKDQLVAQCLAKFCEEKGRAFSLFLCKVKYTNEYDPDLGEDEYSEKRVRMESPWIKYGDQAAMPVEYKLACIESEIAPAEFFHDVPFDGEEDEVYTGNAGSRVEQ